MTLTREETARLIARADPAFRRLIERVGPPPARRRVAVADRFGDLIESISHQLLATKAARTIHARVLDVLGGEVSEERVLARSVTDLRGAGLSRTKAEAMRELAAMCADGRIDVSRHGRMSDEAVTAELVQVRGVGPWTAQMYLLFTLGRPDVWPSGDFGVRHGWSLLHGLDEPIPERDLHRAGQDFSGVRSAVAHYCWHAVDQPA